MKKILLILLMINTHLQAQEYFDDVNHNFDIIKMEKKIHNYPEIARFYPLTDGRGIYPDLSKVKLTKIAIIAFNIWDPSIIDKNKSPQSIWNGKDWINRGENMVGSAISYLGMPYLQDEFGKNGIEIITPDSFNTQQSLVYQSFELEYGNNWKKFLADSIGFDLCSAPGYRFIKKPIDIDAEANNQLGVLAEQLGVDAVLIIENRIESNQYFGILKRVQFSLWGTNPGYSDSTQNRGMHYLTSQLDMSIIFSQWDGENKVYESYDGYDKIVTLLSNQMMVEFNRRKLIGPKIH